MEKNRTLPAGLTGRRLLSREDLVIRLIRRGLIPFLFTAPRPDGTPLRQRPARRFRRDAQSPAGRVAGVPDLPCQVQPD